MRPRVASAAASQRRASPGAASLFNLLLIGGMFRYIFLVRQPPRQPSRSRSRG